MNNIVDKLKILATKHFYLQHGEKIGVVILAAVVVMCLMSTNWAVDTRDPAALVDMTEEAQQLINASKWPEAKQEEVAVVNFMEQAQEMVEPLDVDPFRYTTTMSEPLVKPQQLVTEPKWLPVQNLIADAGAIVVELLPEEDYDYLATQLGLGPNSTNELPSESAGDETRSVDLSLRRRVGRFGETQTVLSKRSRGLSANEARTTLGQRGRAQLPGTRERRERDEAKRRRGARDGVRGRRSGGYDPSGVDDRGLDNGPMMRAQGLRYAAVRGVFPLRKQGREIGNALRFDIPEEGTYEVLFRDFKLQRQTAVPGPNPWKDENWEDIDIQAAVENFAEVANFDIDVIDLRVTDSVITMPLVERLLGYWSDHATHPLLEQFTLSDEERKQMNDLNSMIAKELAEQQAEETRGQGGFSLLVRNMNTHRDKALREKVKEMKAKVKQDVPDVQDRVLAMYGLSDQVLTQAGRERRELQKRLKNRMADDHDSEGGSNIRQRGNRRAANFNRAGRGGLRNNPDRLRSVLVDDDVPQGMEAAAGRMLLFRYFDFTVEPGQAYRYRVKLVFDNPNYQTGVTREEVDDESVIQGEFRESAWSEPTPVVYVPEDTQMFVTKTLQSTKPGRSGATFEIFQWHRKLGTIIQDKSMQCYFGEFVGGKTTTAVLNLGNPSFMTESATFSSDVALVDAKESPEVDLNDHPDLKDALAGVEGYRGGEGSGVGVPTEVVVISLDGRARRMDSMSGIEKRNELQAKLSALQDQFADWKEVGSNPQIRRLIKSGILAPGAASGMGRGGNALRRGLPGGGLDGDANDS